MGNETAKEIYFLLRQKGLNEKSAFYFSNHPSKFKAEMIGNKQYMEV